MSSQATSSTTFDPAAPAVRKLIRSLLHPLKFRLYQWRRLPSLAFWRVRVGKCTPDEAAVTIRYRWRTQNPFRSIYFAALCGAAELSTGLLALIAIEERAAVSMLVTGVEGEFVKKAKDSATFVCKAGPQIREIVQKAIDTGEGQTVKVETEGRNEAGELVCRFYFTWSFKVRS